MRWTDKTIENVKLPEDKKQARHKIAPGFYLLVERRPSGRITKKFALHAKGHGLGMGVAHDGTATVRKLDTVLAEVYELKRRMTDDPGSDPIVERDLKRAEKRAAERARDVLVVRL